MAFASDQEFQDALTQARGNERVAWERLYQAFSPHVLGYLRSQRALLADDLLGEVWLQVVRDLDRFSGGSIQFRAWLLRIAHNRIVDSHRSEQRRPAIADTDTPDVADTSADAASSIARDEALSRLEDLLETLPDMQCAVVYLRFVLDLRQQDVAAVMGISTPAVKMLQLRATRAISRKLGRRAG